MKTLKALMERHNLDRSGVADAAGCTVSVVGAATRDDYQPLTVKNTIALCSTLREDPRPILAERTARLGQTTIPVVIECDPPELNEWRNRAAVELLACRTLADAAEALSSLVVEAPCASAS